MAWNAVEAEVTRARDALHAARQIVVFTGAGVSAESGVPTFRAAGGLWGAFKAEDLATPEAFARDPRLVWEWYGWRRELVAKCVPNAAHVAIARLTIDRPGVTLVTQNVDGLHQRAMEMVGADPSSIVALHGTLFGVRCTGCGLRTPHHDAIDASTPDTLPHCTSCGALLRPDVVWFGETLDEEVLGAAFGAARTCDACLVVGTSALVQPAASVATLAARAGAVLIEVNAEETPLSGFATVSLRGGAATLVPMLLAPTTR